MKANPADTPSEDVVAPRRVAPTDHPANPSVLRKAAPVLADFGGRLILRLKDPKRTELAVSRDRVRPLKDRLGLT